MKRCSHKECQFQDFLQLQIDSDIVYFDDENCDIYCIFHAPKKIKKNFRISQLELFNYLITEYIEKNKVKNLINFSDVIFTNYNFFHKNQIVLDLRNCIINFKGSIFLKNIRFDNIKCKRLILEDCYFIDGGGIKNRHGDKNLEIEKLIFKPYEVGSDFVIDVGRYIDRDLSLVQSHEGSIKNISFENHKIGAGSIFFIGISKNVEGHFENMLLDKVYFQNCDFQNCYFLNAKIEKTEFRNCKFPLNTNMKNPAKVKSKNFIWEYLLTPLLFVFITFIVSTVLPNILQGNTIGDVILSWGYLVLLVLVALLMFIKLDIWIETTSFYLEKILNKIGSLYRGNNFKPIDGFNKHFCIADERKIFRSIENGQYYDKEEKKNQIFESLESLSSVYSQLKNNFQEKNFQKAGDFFYTQRYIEVLSIRKIISTELFVLQLHHLTNGFGEKFMKPFVWFFVTLFVFTYIFSTYLRPNNDYISTEKTPLYLLQDINTSCLKSNAPIQIIFDGKRTLHYLHIEGNNENKQDLFGYDAKRKMNFSNQYIIKLQENIDTALAKSMSNMIYPFAFIGMKQWFYNVSQVAIMCSFIETLLLWYFAGAFILALWHRIKR